MYSFTVSDHDNWARIITIKSIGLPTEEEWEQFKLEYKEIYNTYCTEQYEQIGIIWELTEAEMLPMTWVYQLATILYNLREHTRSHLIGCGFIIDNYILQTIIENLLLRVFPITKPFHITPKINEGNEWLLKLFRESAPDSGI